MARLTLPKTKAQKNWEKRQRCKDKRQAKRQEIEGAEKIEALCVKVLDTTELLEMILLRLPMKDLLLAQRVSRRWKAVIDKSQDLQKALFFRPATPQMAVLHLIDADGRRLPHSLAGGSTVPNFANLFPYDPRCLTAVNSYEKFRYMFTLAFADASPQDRAEINTNMGFGRQALRSIVSRTKIFLNPLTLSRLCSYRHLFTNDLKSDMRAYAHGNRLMRMSKSARRPEASWRRMLVTQPPLAAFGGILKHPRAVSPPIWNLTLEADLTRPLILEKVRTYLEELPSGGETEIFGYDVFSEWQDGGDLAQLKMGIPIEEEELLESMATLRREMDKFQSMMVKFGIS